MAEPQSETAVLVLRERIIQLARIWDEESVEPAEDFADALLDDLGVYPLGCLDPLGGVHFPQHDHEHEEGDPGCRLVVALGVYLEAGDG